MSELEPESRSDLSPAYGMKNGCCLGAAFLMLLGAGAFLVVPDCSNNETNDESPVLPEKTKSAVLDMTKDVSGKNINPDMFFKLPSDVLFQDFKVVGSNKISTHEISISNKIFDNQNEKK